MIECSGRRARTWAALLVFLASFATAALAQAPNASALLPALRRGGYVLFLRHFQTNSDQADVDPLHLENVQAQRQLSDDGRAQAKAVGAALRKLQIPFERVVASKFNRALETARLLELGEVVGSLDVSEGGLVVTPRENQRRAAALKALLGTRPAAGKNVLVVSHRPNLQDAAGKDFGDLGEGEIAIFQPLENSAFKLIARIPAARWSEWANAQRTPTPPKQAGGH